MSTSRIAGRRTAASLLKGRVVGRRISSQATRVEQPSAPKPITSVGVSFTSSETTIPTRNASTAGVRGRTSAQPASTPRKTTQITIVYQDEVAPAHETCRRGRSEERRGGEKG